MPPEGRPVSDTVLRGLRDRLVAARLYPATICLVLGLVGALSMVVLTPPLQVADEGQHFARAYQLSELHVWSRTHDGEFGDDLPASLTAFIVRFLGTAEAHVTRGVPTLPLDSTLKALDQPLNPHERSFLAFPGAASYSPLPYIPQASAIGFGRLLAWSPLALLYLARLANAVAAVVLVAAAVRLAPVGKEILLVVGLLPMALYEYASASPDAMVIASALLFTALALRMQLRGCWSRAEMAGAIASSLVFCSLKPVYLPLLLVGLFPAVLRREIRTRALVTHGILVAFVVGATFAWLRSTASVFVLPRAGTSGPGQTAFIAHHLPSYAAILWATLRTNLVLYYKSMVGAFGWMLVLSPTIAYVLPLVSGLVLLVYRDRRDEQATRAGAAWSLALAACCGLLVLTALYVMWTPVGAPLVEGVQGRYFLPIAGIAAFALLRLMPRLPSRAPDGAALLCCAVLYIVQLAIADMTIVSAFAVL